tara:strand:+ start:74 stop:940 length:867 start_codon:yes stop_codon:yes gene_type:complete
MIVRVDPDIIHSHMGRSDIFSAICKPKKTKLVNTMHTMKRFTWSNGLFNLTQILYYFTDYKYDMRISISKIVNNSWYQCYLSSPNTIINNPVELVQFKKNGMYSVNNKKTIQLLFVGRLIKLKNPMLPILAMKHIIAKYPKIHLNIVGEGPEKEKLVKYIKDNSLENYVSIIGLTNDVEKYYEKSDILIVSSNWTSGIPLVSLEAAMYKIPLLLPDVGGIKEFFRNNETAILYKHGNVLDLTTKLIELIEDNELGQKIASNAITKLSKKYSPEKVAKKYLSIYKQLLN